MTAVLGMSDVVQIISRTPGNDAKAFQYSGYASFAKGELAEPENEELDLSDDAVAAVFDERIVSGEVDGGTHVRVKINLMKDDSVLGYTLHNFTADKFVNLLGLYTPVG